MRNAILLLFITVIALPSLGQDRYARIGLLRKHSVKSVTIMSAKGGSIVYADGERKGEIQSNDGLRIEVLSGGLSAKS